MFANPKNIAAIIVIALFISGCMSSLYMPTNNDALKYNTSINDLMKGRELYVKSCSSCHNLHLPSEYTKERWMKSLNKMQKRAKIDDTKKDLIAKYLLTNCKDTIIAK